MLPRHLLTVSLAVLTFNQLTSIALAEKQRLPGSGSVETDELSNQKPDSRLKVPEPSNSLLQEREQNSPNQNNSFSSQEPREVTIPKSSAVITTFCSNVLFNQEQASSFPVTLSLARPIMDSNGNVIAPINSLIRANINATEDEGIKIEPKAVIIGGQYIPINTSSVAVPALTDTRRGSSTFYSGGFNRGQRGIAYRVSDNLSDWLVSRPTALGDEQSNLLSFGLSIAAGVAQGINEPNPPDREETKVMEIRQGMQLIFPLETSITLPPMATQRNPYFTTRTPTSACQDGQGTQDPAQYVDNNEVD